MKKTIILFLFILPVIIVVLVFAIAGFVGRAVMYVEIENVTVNTDALFTYAAGDGGTYRYTQQNQDDQFYLDANPGGVYELEKFVSVYPERARFSDLDFVISNPAAVKIESGRIHVLQNLRSSDGDSVEVKLTYGDKLFLTVYTQIETDNTRFDYFGFNHAMLAAGITGQPWAEYISAGISDGVVKINRDKTAGLSYTIALGRILRDGFDTAPKNLLYNGEYRDAFLSALEFKSDNDAVITVTPLGAGEFSAAIKSAGEAVITVSADYLGERFEVAVPVRVS